LPEKCGECLVSQLMRQLISFSGRGRAAEAAGVGGLVGQSTPGQVVQLPPLKSPHPPFRITNHPQSRFIIEIQRTDRLASKAAKANQQVANHCGHPSIPKKTEIYIYLGKIKGRSICSISQDAGPLVWAHTRGHRVQLMLMLRYL